MAVKKKVVEKPTHKALRPIKHNGEMYNPGDTLELDDITAQQLGHNVQQIVTPVSAMSSAELIEASKAAAEREKAEKKAARTAKTADQATPDDEDGAGE